MQRIENKDRDQLEQEQDNLQQQVELDNLSRPREGIPSSQQSGWYKDTTLVGIDTKTLFINTFAQCYNTCEKVKQNKVTRMGVQCLSNSTNSPMKAGKQLFSGKIRNLMVTYTNEYGSAMAKEWDKINKDDILQPVFICICFISAIEKKDKIR